MDGDPLLAGEEVPGCLGTYRLAEQGHSSANIGSVCSCIITPTVLLPVQLRTRLSSSGTDKAYLPTWTH